MTHRAVDTEAFLTAFEQLTGDRYWNIGEQLTILKPGLKRSDIGGVFLGNGVGFEGARRSLVGKKRTALQWSFVGLHVHVPVAAGESN
jgi:hypothetical protein